jgi:hypothetical protein
MIMMMIIASSRDVMGELRVGRPIAIGGWIATVLMGLLVLSLGWSAS